MSDCFCFGAGEFFGLNSPVPEGSVIIAADGGLNAVKSCGLKADIVVGDFDSLGEIPENENVKVLPVEKDVTDLYEAVRLGEEKGCRVFRIYGGTGGRIDHTFANIQLIGDLARRGMRGFLYGERYVFTAICRGGLRIDGEKGGKVSVFSLTDRCDGVTLKGLRYPLNDHTLTNLFPLGVSNEFLGGNAEISVKQGILLVYYTFQP